MTVQRDYPDFSNAGDTGENTVDAIQPIESGEGATQSAFRRPSENLRSRTEILRENVRDLNYYRDAAVYACSTTGTLTWGGTVLSGGTGILTNTGPVTIRPLLTPRTSLKAQLSVGASGINAVVYEVAAAAYASDGMNNVSVEHRDGGVGTTLTTLITEGPVKRILVVFDAANTAHDSAAVTSSVSAAIAADLGAGGLGVAPVKITVTDDGVAGTTIAAAAEQRLEGTADAEAHLVPAAALTSLTTTTPLVEGDCIAVWYRYVVEPAGGDPSDPKVGLAGGRWESNADRGNETITNNLFITSVDPDKIPGAIPLCKVIENQLVWLDGSRFDAGTPAVFGMATDLSLDTSGFAGANTNVNNGGIPTTLASPQVQSAMDGIDDRLAQLRGITYTCTDGTASVGGDFNGTSAVDNAISALAGTGGTIFLRRGTYNLAGPTFAIPSDVILIGESKALVTLDTATTVTMGSDSQLHNLTIDADLTINATNDRGRISHVKITGALDHQGDSWVVEDLFMSTSTLLETIVFRGSYNKVTNFFAQMSSSFLGDNNVYENIAIGTCPADVLASSVYLLGNNNQFRNVTLEPRAADFSSANASVITVDGVGNVIDGVSTDQSTGALTAERVGLELRGAEDCVVRNARVLMGAGIPLMLNDVGSRACVNIKITDSRFQNDSSNANDVTALLPSSGINNHTVSFVECVFDTSEQIAHELIDFSTDANSQQYFNYRGCTFIGGRLVGAASIFTSSSFEDCEFRIQNPESAGRRQLGGTASTQLNTLWDFTESVGGVGCVLNNCRFDMLDSEVEIDGGEPTFSVPLIARFQQTTTRDLSVLRMNEHVRSTDGAGLFGLGGESHVDGLEISWTGTAAVGAGTPLLSCIFFDEATGRPNTVENVIWDYDTGGAYDGTPVFDSFFSFNATATYLRGHNIKLKDTTSQLILSSTGAIVHNECTFIDCQMGGLTQGLIASAGMTFVGGSKNRYINCTWYLSGTGAVATLELGLSYVDCLFEGCVWWQLPTNVTTATGMFAGFSNTVDRLKFTGCTFITDRTAGARAFETGFTFTETVGAGNIYKVTGGGTSTAPGFSASVNSW